MPNLGGALFPLPTVSYDGYGVPFNWLAVPRVWGNGSAGDPLQFKSDSIGWTGIIFQPQGITAHTTQRLVIAYSTSIDSVGVKAALDSYITTGSGRITAPDGQLVSNVRVLAIGPGIVYPPLTALSSAPIKSIMLGVSGQPDISGFQVSVDFFKTPQ